jgi:phage gp45-like
MDHCKMREAGLQSGDTALYLLKKHFLAFSLGESFLLFFLIEDIPPTR